MEEKLAAFKKRKPIASTIRTCKVCKSGASYMSYRSGNKPGSRYRVWECSNPACGVCRRG